MLPIFLCSYILSVRTESHPLSKTTGFKTIKTSKKQYLFMTLIIFPFGYCFAVLVKYYYFISCIDRKQINGKKSFEFTNINNAF